MTAAHEAPPAGPLVDFHRHWFPPGIVPATPPPGLDALAAIWPLLGDLDAQLEASARAGIDVTVVNAPLSSLLSAATGPAASELPSRINDALAQAVAERGPRLEALATVDAFAGDAGAREAMRAVDELGLPGLLVDAARGDLLLTAPEARPVLEFAADRGVPVFAHPVNPPVLPPRYAVPGAGILLARGSESALSTLALLVRRTLDDLPGLRLVIAGIGVAALALAGFLDGPEDGADGPSAARSHIHIDTMGFDPAAVRFALDVVGPERVVVGSDWPIMWRDASRARVDALLAGTGLDAHGRSLVAGGNALRLLGRGAP